MGKDYGEKLLYDSMWKGPLEISRKKTDAGAFRLFFVFISIWLGIGCYVFFALDPQSNLRPKRNAKYDDVDAPIIRSSMLLILGCTILSGLLSLIYILMMRWWAKLMVYFILIIVWISMLAGIIVLMSDSKSKQDIQIKTGGAIFLVIILVASITLVIVFRKKIAIACAMIQEAAKTAMFFPSHFLLPLFLCPPLISVSILALLFAGKLFEYEDGGVTAFTGILHLYNVCAFLWIWNFISGTKHMIFSSSFATWYWTMNKDYVPVNTLSRSIEIVSKYHFGTVAFGSLVISVCQIIKGFLKSASRRAGESGDAAAGSIMMCFSCCCENLMEYVEYVNRNAYIMSAIHGTDFLTSAKNAFNLIMRNVGKVIVTTEVTSLLLYTGVTISCFIPAGIAFIQTDFRGSVDYIYSTKLQVALIVSVFSLILSAAIFTILQSAVETIFICAIEDYERNDGSDERPYYMSTKLKKLLLNDDIGI